MTPLGWLVFGYALEILVAAIAIHLARSRSYHRPAARYLAVLAAADIARGVLAQTLLRAPRPYTGAFRAVYNLDQVLTLAEPIGLAWCALAVFWPAKIAWRERALGVAIFVTASILVSYPQLRGTNYGRALLGVWIAAQAIVWSAAVAWRTRHRGEWPHFTHRLVLIYAAGQLVAQAGPVLAGSIFADWRAGFGACVLLQLVALVQQVMWIGVPIDVGSNEPTMPPRARARARAPRRSKR